MGEICWRLWVTRVSNELPLFWRHDFAFPVGVETFFKLRMFGEQRVWGSLLVRVSFDYPSFGVDYSKLFFVKSPCHT
uniref:Uncharacterized protein n=1 Tax=Fagus sylvatica TaxID=28930 RepID=A0A2N9EP29_FAGSY